jgi:hypothetical protein
MNISYLMYQAERPRSAAEQREADVHAGEVAAAFAQLGRAGRRAVTRRHAAGRQGPGRHGTRGTDLRTTPVNVACAVPRPR